MRQEVHGDRPGVAGPQGEQVVAGLEVALGADAVVVIVAVVLEVAVAEIALDALFKSLK